MSRNRQTPNLLAITLLVISVLACQTITKATSPNPATPVSVLNGGDVRLSLDWLVTADELNSFSTDIGIIDWKLEKDTPGEKRICRTFRGDSWSASPNEGLNCIYTITPGSSFADIIDSMFSEGNLLEGSEPVNSTLKFDGEYAVYAGNYPNGHTVIDLMLIENNLFYWSSVTLGTPAGATPLAVYQSAPQIIDSFLANVVKINLEKTK